jgi:hypothetical protein
MRFLNAEIGKDRQIIYEYLTTIPKIDMIYNAPPNPASIGIWYKMAGNNTRITYKEFIENLFEIYKYISPKTITIEVLENKETVLCMLSAWGYYESIKILPITYTAPLKCGKPGMSYCRKPNEIIIATNDIGLNLDFTFVYSYEFLSGFFEKNPQYITGFDPCIGKGLLVRYCHDPYGIEMNQDRLKEAVKTFELK